MESKKIAEEIKQELVKCFVASENRYARKNYEDKKKQLNQQVKKSFLATSDIIRENAKIRGNDVEFNRVLKAVEKVFIECKGNIEKKVLENINQRENEVDIRNLSTNLSLDVAAKINETLEKENLTLESISDVSDSVNKTVEKLSKKREFVGEKFSEKMETQIDDLIKTELKTKLRRIISTSSIGHRVDIYKLESDIGRVLEGKFVTPLKEEFKRTDEQNIDDMKTDENALGKLVANKLEKIVKNEIEQKKNEKTDVEGNKHQEEKVEELNADFLDELKENVNTIEEVAQNKSCIEEEKELTKDKERYSLPGDVII